MLVIFLHGCSVQIVLPCLV